MSDGQAIWYDKMRESLEVNSQIYLNDAAGASDGGKNGKRYHKNISRMYAGQNSAGFQKFSPAAGKKSGGHRPELRERTLPETISV